MKLRDRIAQRAMQPSRCYRQSDLGTIWGNDLRSHWYWTGELLGSLDPTASFAGRGSTLTIYYTVKEEDAEKALAGHAKIEKWLSGKGVKCLFEVTIEPKGADDETP